MVLHIMKYSELNFPALSDFGKIHNYMIIQNVIHFRGTLGVWIFFAGKR